MAAIHCWRSDSVSTSIGNVRARVTMSKPQLAPLTVGAARFSTLVHCVKSMMPVARTAHAPSRNVREHRVGAPCLDVRNRARVLFRTLRRRVLVGLVVREHQTAQDKEAALPRLDGAALLEHPATLDGANCSPVRITPRDR